MSTRIPMHPDELPQQKVYAVTDLPEAPSNFEATCLMQFGSRGDCDGYEWSIPEADLPKRFPGAAKFIAQVNGLGILTMIVSITTTFAATVNGRIGFYG